MNYDTRSEIRNGINLVVIFDVLNKKVKDFFYISKVGECDSLTPRFVSVVTQQVQAIDDIYSRDALNLSLSALYNMRINDDKWLSIETSITLVDIILRLKNYYLADDLYYLSGKVTEQGRDAQLDKISKFNSLMLTGDDVFFLTQRLKVFGLDSKIDFVLPEIIRIAERDALSDCQKGIAEWRRLKGE
jgi:hypothetical protein